MMSDEIRREYLDDEETCAHEKIKPGRSTHWASGWARRRQQAFSALRSKRTTKTTWGRCSRAPFKGVTQS